jgi:hypothetical protein
MRGKLGTHPNFLSFRKWGASLILCLFLSGCGKVGDPQPPFIRIPEAVKDLAVTQSGYNLILTWTNPTHYVDGSAATNLARVQIRNNGAPLTAVNAGKAGEAQSYSTLAQITGTSRTFSVIVETSQGKVSNTSNVASITPVEVPGRVSQAAGYADQRKLILRWNKPQDHPELADVYIVTRTDIPAESATVTDTSYEDSRYDLARSFTYQVTSARRVAGNLVMGVGPESFIVSSADKTPPAPPAGFDIRQSDTGAFLVWEPNSETDLAGYWVYRSEHADNGFRRINEKLITGNGLYDPSYRSGLYYAVSAVDESGNESRMTPPFQGP